MALEQQDFEMDSGESKIIEITATESDGTKINLDGATIKWAIYNSKGVLVEKVTGNGITITDSSNGIFEIKLDPSDTVNLSGKYRHITRLTDQLLNQNDITKGMVTINPSPTLP